MKFLANSKDVTAHSQKCGLVKEALDLYGAVRLRVIGQSMLPSIVPGDTLLIQRKGLQQIAAGDLLLYGRENRFFVHRVVSAINSRECGITTQGDALPEVDPPVLYNEVLGTVSCIFRNGNSFRPSSRLKYHERLIGVLTWKSDILARLVVLLTALLNKSWWSGVQRTS